MSWFATRKPDGPATTVALVLAGGVGGTVTDVLPEAVAQVPAASVDIGWLEELSRYCEKLEKLQVFPLVAT